MEHRWNDTERGRRKQAYWGKTYCSAAERRYIWHYYGDRACWVTSPTVARTFPMLQKIPKTNKHEVSVARCCLLQVKSLAEERSSLLPTRSVWSWVVVAQRTTVWRMLVTSLVQILSKTYKLHLRLHWWSRGSVLVFGTQVRGFTPGRSRRISRAKKILSTPSFGGEVKPSVGPMS